MRLIVLILLLFALPAMADTLTVSVNRGNGDTNITEPLVLTPANIGAATAAQGAKADSALQSADYKVKNVLKLGILNNGTDQGAAIQALLDAASANDTFYFPTGDYGTTVQLKLPSDKMIRIIGDGPGATKFTAKAAIRSVFLKEGARQEGIEFRDFWIEGGYHPAYADVGIILRSGVETKIENVYIVRVKEAGITFGVPYAWDSTRTYHTHQHVAYGGHIYRSLQDANLNHTPSVGGTAYWADLETYDTAPTSNLVYDTRMKSVTIRSGYDGYQAQPLYGIHQYASANDNWIGNSIIADFAIASVFDEAGYTFYHKLYTNGSPLSTSPTYGIWSVTQFGNADAVGGITVDECYFDGIGPQAGGGAAIRLDQSGNLITNSTFFRAGSATTNAGIEMKNGITRTSIMSNKFDNVVPTTFQGSGTYGAEYYFVGNVGGLSPGSGVNVINGKQAALINGPLTTGKQLGLDASGFVYASSYDLGGTATGPSSYPAAGVPVSTGSAWGSSLAVGTGANNLVQLNGSSQLPAVSGALLTNLPNQLSQSSITLNASSTSATTGVSVQRGDADFATGTAYDILNINKTFSASAPAAGASMRALNVTPFYSGVGTLGTLYGAFFSPRNTGSGTVSSLIGANFWLRNTSTGTLSGITGLYVQAPTNSGTINGAVNGIKIENHGLSGVTNSYGLYMDNQSGSTNNYAIYTGTGKVYHGDDVTAKTFTGTIPAATTYGATTTIDLSLGDSPSVTLTGNPTLAFSNPKAGQWHVLDIIQGTGGNTVTWPSTGLVCTWRNADGTTTAPTLLSTAGAHNFFLIHTKSTTAADCFAR